MMIQFYDLPKESFEQTGLPYTKMNKIKTSFGVDENKDVYVSCYHTGSNPKKDAQSPENRVMLSYLWEGLPVYEHPSHASGGHNIFIQLQFISDEIKTDFVKEMVRSITGRLTRESIEHNPIK